MVPEGWRETRLDDIAEKIMVGIASAATHAYSNRGVRMLRNLNIKDGWIDDSDILYVNEEYEKTFRKKRLQLGDILTVRTGYPGVSAVVPCNYEGAQCFTSLITRLNQEEALPEYVCRYINSEYGKRFITAGEAGGAQKNVNAGMLKRMPIPLPPLWEQQEIAKILSTWDEAIATTEQLLANSEQQKKALMQQLLTGKKRLPGFEGTLSTLKISEAARVSMGASPKSVAYNEEGRGLPLLQGNADIKNRKSAPRVYSSEITRECEVGDILLSVRAPVGTVAIAHHNACIGRGICSIRARGNISQDYLYQWMLLYEPKWVSRAQGSTFESINGSDVKNLEIKVPDVSEQRAIAQVLQAADKETDSLSRQIQFLRQEKKALMQQLLTGKRRVKVDEAERATA